MLGHLIILIPSFPFFHVKTKGQRKAKNSSHKKDWYHPIGGENSKFSPISFLKSNLNLFPKFVRFQMTNVISFLLGRLCFFPCQSPAWIVNASIVTVKCLVWTCEKHLPPELYLLEEKINNNVIKTSIRSKKKRIQGFFFYLKNFSNMVSFTNFGPVPYILMISSLSGLNE